MPSNKEQLDLITGIYLPGFDYRYLPGDLFSIKVLLADCADGTRRMLKMISNRKSAHDPQNVGDYIDYYIKRMNEEQQNGSKSTFSGK